MYPVLLKAISSKVSDKLLGGMITSQLSRMEVGAPCILDIGSITAKPYTNRRGDDFVKSILDIMSEDGPVDVINELLSNYGASIPSLVIFPYQHNHGHIILPKAHQLYCFDKKPIIVDEGKIVNAKTVGNIVTKRTVKNFPNRILDNLSNCRYITYILSGM